MLKKKSKEKKETNLFDTGQQLVCTAVNMLSIF